MLDERKLGYKSFLKEMKKFDHIRVAVGGGDYPFEYTYFRVDNEEVAKTVQNNKTDVTYSVMTNPSIKDDIGVLYINALKMKLNFSKDGGQEV